MTLVTSPPGVRPPPFRYRWIWGAIWLVYLVQPGLDAWREPDPFRKWVGLAALVLFGASFLASFLLLPNFSRQAAPALGVLILGSTAITAVVMVTLLGEEQLAAFAYVAVLGMFLLPAPWGLVTAGVLAAGTAVAELLVPGWTFDWSVQFQIVIAGLAMWGVVQIIGRNRELAAAHQEIARLAVEEERNRFARDLHDILGHTLTVVAVKAELAGRLVRADPDRAEAEIADVERLAREALTDVRSAVVGYRDVTLSTELVNARTALAAAGIDAELPAAIDDVPPDRRELFGWVVREGVTNVVRHSGASTCRVHIEPSMVRITDNGPDQSTVDTAPGHGLTGLRERAEASGGALHLGRAPEGGFALTVQL